MSFNLSGLRLVTLEGLGNTNESKKFNRDLWCNGKTDNECKAGELFNLFLENQKGKIPPFEEVLSNKMYLMAIMQMEIPFVMTDKHKNTHIFGYMDDEMQTHTHFRNLWEAGALFKGFDKSRIANNPSQMWYRDRQTGMQWYEGTANGLLADGNMFLKLARANEQKGYNPVPYFYIVKDVVTYDWWDVTKIALNAVMAIGSTFIPAIGTFLTPSMNNGINQLVAIGDRFKNDGNYQFTFDDFKTIVVDAFAPVIGLDKTFNTIMNKAGVAEGQAYLDVVKNLSIKAHDSYRAIEQFNGGDKAGALQKLGKILEIDGDRTLNYLRNDLALNNIVDVAKAIKKPIAEAEKIVNQMNNSEILNSLVDKFTAYELRADLGDALKMLPTQQFLVNVQSAVKGGIEELTGAIPNSPGIIGAISKSVKELKVEEFAGLLNIPLNLPIGDLSVFDNLTTKAMVERARSYAMANIPFVLPSNLSEDLQQKLVNHIPRVVTNADVRTVSVKPKFYMEFL